MTSGHKYMVWCPYGRHENEAWTISSSQIVDLVFIYFTFYFYFHSVLFFYFLFLEQLGLGLIGHAVISVTT